MAYGRVQLIDPAGALATYSWDVNYNTEDGFNARRELEVTPNTAGTGFIVQQGADQPMAISFSGKFTKPDQHRQFIAYYAKCKFQSIYFRDFETQLYEVMMTAYLPKRTRAARNPRGGEQAKFHYYEYSMEMTVLRVISGDWVGV